MRKHLIYIIGIAGTLLSFLSSCSETKNLAADEILYTGIKRVDYDTHREVADTVQKEGVITALGKGYDAVNELIQGNSSALQALQEEHISKRQRDSLSSLSRQDREAYDLAKTEVEGVLAKSPNNSLMGSSYHRFPLPIGLWIYNRNVYKTSRWSRWLMNNFAANPIYLTELNPRVRTRVAQNTLRNFGFFHAQVGYDTIPEKNPKKAKVAYSVQTGPLFRLDTISYQRFDTITDSLIRATMHQSLLRQGAPFSVRNLDGERTRISTLLRNNGFYYFLPSYITFRADTIMRPQHVQLQVRPLVGMPNEARRQYYLGRTRISLYENEAFELVDSIRQYSTTLAYSGQTGRPPLKLRAMRRNMRYRRGMMYNQDGVEHMQDALSSMGVFSQLSIDFVPRDSLGSDTLDILVNARLDKPYDSEFRGNVANKSNGLLGPGVSFSMSRKNAFRGGETVSLNVHGRYEWLTGAQTEGSSQRINSYEYGVDLNLTFPRLTMLTLGQRINRRAITSTNYKLSATWLNRSGYYGQVSWGARLTYSYQRKRTIRHELTPFRLDYNHLLHTSQRYQEIIVQNPALYVSMRDQFVPSMQYTLNMTSRAGARNPRTLTLDIKEAGNVTSVFSRATGKDWRLDNKEIFGVPYAQYFRVSAQITEKYKVRSTRTYLVGRLFAGAIFSYGNSAMAPYNDLFSIGGANSIRAFSVRSIGPGSYRPENSRYSYIDQVGNMKLEANVEYRFPLIGSLEGAMFLDAGNVWLLKPDSARPGASFNPKTFGKEIALGTGFGFRYDLDFLVIRFDVGIGIHAPYETSRRGYYNMPKFWDSLGYHIAVGYPF